MEALLAIALTGAILVGVGYACHLFGPLMGLGIPLLIALVLTLAGI